MSPVHFLNIYLAETERLFRRATAIAGLILSAVFGLLGPTIIAVINVAVIAGARTYVAEQSGGDPDLAIEGSPEFLTWDAAVYMTYWMRNFMFLPILIFLLGGLSMASEFVARTTREDVLRPVPRYGLLLSKWLALFTWILAATALAAGLSALGGMVVAGGVQADPEAWALVEGQTGWAWFTAAIHAWWLGFSGPLAQIGVTILTDLGFATLALAFAVLTRSVAATVAGLVMVFTIQVAVSFGFMVATFELTRNMLGSQVPWIEPDTLSTAFEWIDMLSKWQPPFVIGMCSLSEVYWQSFVTLGVLTLGSLVIGLLRFESMDVP